MPGTNDSLGAPRDRGEALLMQVRDAAAGGETHADTFDEPWTRQEALLMQIRDAIAAGGEGPDLSGYATLDAGGKVPASQLPSYVDDVIEVANYAALPAEGEGGKIYVATDTGKCYRWTGSTYVEIAPAPDLTSYATKAYVDEALGVVENGAY